MSRGIMQITLKKWHGISRKTARKPLRLCIRTRKFYQTRSRNYKRRTKDAAIFGNEGGNTVTGSETAPSLRQVYNRWCAHMHGTRKGNDESGDERNDDLGTLRLWGIYLYEWRFVWFDHRVIFNDTIIARKERVSTILICELFARCDPFPSNFNNI